MCTSIKIYTALSILAIAGSFAYRFSNFLFEQLTNQNYLTSLEYKYLGNSDKDKFSNWKVNYSLFQKHLANNISMFKQVKDETEGGFLLKKWCSDKINKILDKEDVKLIKKYCVINLKNVVLGEPNVKTVDDMGADERRQFFNSNKSKCHKEIKHLHNWCSTNFRLAHIPKNIGILEKVKTCCVVNTQFS